MPFAYWKWRLEMPDEVPHWEPILHLPWLNSKVFDELLPSMSWLYSPLLDVLALQIRQSPSEVETEVKEEEEGNEEEGKKQKEKKMEE